MIIEDHGGQAASPSVGVQVQVQVVLLTASLGLAVGVEVVKVDCDELSHIRHQQLDSPAENKSEQISTPTDLTDV